MPVNIHGKEYKTVAERLNEAHANNDFLGCETEVLFLEPQVMVKATIKTKLGMFTGISAANPSKSIEANTPVEVAETSAVGRALSFAGYAGSEIASAEEMVKAGVTIASVVASKPASSLTMRCELHDAEMREFMSKKTGKPYFRHTKDDGSFCFGEKKAKLPFKEVAQKYTDPDQIMKNITEEIPF